MTRSVLSIVAICMIIFITASAGYADIASFQGLGDLSGDPGFFSSKAFGISDDGSVIVGDSSSLSGTGSFQGNEAFRWAGSGPMMGLGELSGGGFHSVAFDASADGALIVGQGRSDAAGLGSDVFEAVSWTMDSGMVGLGDLAGGIFHSEATGVSPDGSFIIGSGNSDFGQEAFRWNITAGMVGLGDLPGGIFDSRALDISADGSIVVGFSNSGSGNEAFRWTVGGSIVGLGDLSGGIFNSQATAVSSDGSVVAGFGKSDMGNEAFRWTDEGGMVGLGDLPGGDFGSVVTDMSANGSVIVGDGKSVLGDEAFIWDHINGMRSLRDVLVNDLGLGLAFSGWELTDARGISADGTVIVGFGTNPDGNTEAWRVVLPEPSTLLLLAAGGVGLLRRRAV
jgi:probable HAF family extracellular repeat protein